MKPFFSLGVALVLSLSAMSLTAIAQMKPLEAGVTKVDYLPPAMYGHWSITGTLMDTNRPDGFPPVVNNIWILEQSGDRVIVINPVTGATAAVDVEQVQNNTAKFHRVDEDRRERIAESPTVTVDGDRLYGVTFQQVRRKNILNGKLGPVYYARYRLEAIRIGDARVKFGIEPEKQDVQFEIEEVQRR
jgi:hypothetical protein